MSNFISLGGEVADDFENILEMVTDIRGRKLNNKDRSKILEDALSIGLNSIGMILDRTLNENGVDYENLPQFSQEHFLFEVSEHYPAILRGSNHEEFLSQRYSESPRSLSITGNLSVEDFSKEKSLKKKSRNAKKKKTQENRKKKKNPDEDKKKKKKNEAVE